MIEINIKTEDSDEMCNVREMFHNALVGSPAYIDSEIAICDEDDTSFTLVIGTANEDNLMIQVNASNILAYFEDDVSTGYTKPITLLYDILKNIKDGTIVYK